MKRTIVHADMDAFYAAVEQLDNPEYRGQPVIVGSDPENGKGRGVVSTCSYEARRFGIHSAMPISRAWKLCPHGIYVFPRMERYMEISRKIMEVFGSFSPLVEPLSLDEAFLDCSGTERLFGDEKSLGEKIKDDVRSATGLTVSVGVAANKFMAKIASDLEKPDGLTIVPRGGEREFLAPLPIRKLWGVGPRTAEKMERVGVRLIGDLARLEEQVARSLFGNHGETLLRLSRGEDDRPVESGHERKSISEERTFRVDREDREEIEKVFFRLADELSRRMRKAGFQGRTVQVKIRDSSFHTITRQSTVAGSISSTDPIFHEAIRLFRKSDPGGPLRLVGIGITGLSDLQEEPDLFSYSKREKTDKMDQVLDTLKERFQDRVSRATLLKLPDREKKEEPEQ